MGGDTPKTQTETTKTGETGTTTGTQTGTTTGATTGFTSGLTSGQTAGTSTVNLPDWLKPFVTGAVGTAGNALGDFQQGIAGYQLPPEAMDALTSTARGDYLYGGPQQQAFIDAARRAAQPGIYSAFGAAGRGGAGLENAALNQSSVDAFANLFNQERGRQLGAAEALPGISMLPLQLQQQLAQLAGGLPGQFAPFLGQSTSGMTSGLTSGFNTGMTSGTMAGTQTGTTDTSGTSTLTKPLYQTPWWQTALGAGTAGLGLLGSLNPATGFGAAASGVPIVGSLVGAFR